MVSNSSDICKTSKYLAWHVNRRPVLSGDWFWLTSKFLPSIRAVEQNIDNSELISLCYYMVGDVFDFQDAPQEAIKYYKLSIKYCKNHASAYRETGCMLTRLKKYDRAFQYLEKARLLDESDLRVKEDLEFLHEVRQIRDAPFSKNEKNYNQCAELLAQGKASKVLGKINNPRSVLDHQFRARAYGLLRDKKTFINEWKSMLDYDEKIEPLNADWFYMPQNVWNDFRFWNILHKLRGRFIPGVYPYTKKFHNKVIISSTQSNDNTKIIMSCNKRFELFIQHQLARLQRNQRER